MSAVGPALIVRRKRLMSEFEKNGATCKEKAVTIQEVYDHWQYGFIRPLRMIALTMDIRFLCRKGKLTKTDDEQYYLNIGK